jgi:tRNA-dihydrouridine synthase B
MIDLDVMNTWTFGKDNPIQVNGDLILSPMDGYSDLPFRSVCRELGSAISYTEFINAIDVLGRINHVEEKLVFWPAERPVAFQLFDCDPNRLLEAALRLQEYGPDFIDINMGCSDKSVSGRGAGAGLLRTPHLIAEIFQKLTAALEVPVTGKMRLGWDDDSRNYLQVAKIIEDNGGAMIAVHGRTRQQAYRGEADWDAIAEVCQAVSVPVIGNGDVRTVADIERLKSYTGCHAVMIGRAAVGNPWIFSRLDRHQVPLELVQRTMLLHMQRMLDFHGPQRGLLQFRKHTQRYLAPYALPEDLRRRLLTNESIDDYRLALDQVFKMMVL